MAAGGVAAACSSSDGDAAEPKPGDAGVEPFDASSDAGVDGATVRDAGPVDAAPLPIVCTSPPCATSLVTTLGATVADRGEGFCALLDDGTVACWGANGAGQLGRGDEGGAVDSATPARVVGVSNVVTLDHTCAVDEDGAVWCWGTGPFLRPDAPVTTERTPVRLDLPPATKVGVGYATACAAVEGGVLCWGSNADAQLSPLTATEDVGAPRAMPIPAGAPVRAMAVGRATFVLREDGTLVTWGANPPIGRLSSLFPDPYPDAVELGGVLMVDLAHDDACAVAGGTGYCWGASGLPGKGSPLVRALPEPVVAPEPLVHLATTYTHDDTVRAYRWCASTIAGSVYCWGANESGQAGDGTQDYAIEAGRVRGLPERAAQVKTTPTTTCALLTNGKVYCWGSNYNGQLGNGENKGRSLVPVEVLLP